jgi:SET domain-containing protein
MSFLFDLNSEWCIDAARLGNKTRFINHADNEKNGLNCEAKIVLVNGEHRIKFSALRDIAVGEELLFNYGKKFAEKHGLSKILPKAKEGGKKGVLEGEEALDALDGMDNRKMRGKMMAKRGGHSGSGRPKKRLRKAAVASIRDPLQAAVEAVREEEDMYGTPQEEEDDEEDDETGDGRRHRKTRRPMRYTR